MKITNKHNLPKQLYNAVNWGTRKPSENVISATTLIAPGHQWRLRLDNWDKIEEDCSGRLWALLGQAVHYITEKHELKGDIAEERLKAELDGITITGQADNYSGDGIIEDWKTTSVWSFIYGTKPEWEQQLNIYAWLWRKNGFDVNGLKVHMILRDWVERKSHEDNYPSIPFVTVECELWSIEEQEIFIRDRIKALNNPVECTPDEKWARPTKYAVMKEGRKSAVKLFDSEEYAQKFLDEKDNKHYLEVRPGENIRCKSYCNVSEFCEYNQQC